MDIWLVDHTTYLSEKVKPILTKQGVDHVQLVDHFNQITNESGVVLIAINNFSDELCQFLKQCKQYKKIVVVGIGELLNEAEMTFLFESGLTDYISLDEIYRLPYAIQRARHEIEMVQITQHIPNHVLKSGEQNTLSLNELKKTADVAVGENYFSEITDLLYHVIKPKIVFVGIFKENIHSIETVSFRENGVERPSFCYPFSGKPCELLSESNLLCIPKDLQKKFPNDPDLVEMGVDSYLGILLHNSQDHPVGVLVIMDDHELQEINQVEEISQSLSHRLGNELERHLAEIRLRISEENYRQIIDSQTELIIRWKPDGQVLFANTACLNFMHKTKDEILSINYLNIVRDIPRLQNKINKLSPANSKISDVHLGLYHGTQKWFEWTELGFYDENGVLTEIQSMGRDITEQEEARIELLKEKEKFELYLNTSPSIVLMLDKQGVVQLVNDQACKVMEYSKDELIGKTWFENFVPHAESTKRISKFKKLVEEERLPVEVSEGYILTKTNQVRLIAWRNAVIHDENSRIISYISSGHDITEISEFQKNLTDQQSLLHRVMEITQTGNFIITPGSETRIWSSEMYKIFEVDPDTFIPTRENIYSHIHPDDKSVLAAALQKMINGVDPELFLYRIITGKGRLKYIHAGVFFSHTNEGVVNKIIVTAQDVTKLKSSELKLAERETFLRSILTSLNESIAVIDKEGNIIETNKAWKDFAKENEGLPEFTGVGSNYLKACEDALASGETNVTPILKAIKQILTGFKKNFEFEYPCHSATERRWFRMKISPLYGKINGAVITHTDITAQKLQEFESESNFKEIYHAEKINSALVHNVSDENLTQLIFNYVEDILGSHRGRIYRYYPTENNLQLYAEQIGLETIKIIEKRAKVNLASVIPELVSESIFTQVIHSKKELITSDSKLINTYVKDHSQNKVLRSLSSWAAKLTKIRTLCLIPLFRGDKVSGLLNLTFPIVLNEKEINLVRRFSNLVSVILAKRQDQEELLASEEKFKTIANYTANWETWLDTKGKAIWMNPAAEKYSGYTLDELLTATNFYELIIHPDDYSRVMKILYEVLVNKYEGDPIEFRTVSKNGTATWFSLSWTLVYDKNGAWIGIRTSGKDINQRKIQEEQLGNQRKLLKEAQVIARMGAWQWNIQDETAYLDENLQNLLGMSYKNEPIQKKQLYSLIHSDSITEFEKIVYNAVHDFNARDLELKLIDTNGDIKFFLLRASDSHLLPNQAKHLISGSMLDITELVKTHKEVEESNFRFRKIFESIQDIYYQTTTGGIITMVSPSVEKLLGYTPEEVIGKHISFLYVLPKIRDLKFAKQNIVGEIREFEASLVHKDGSEVIVSVNLSKLFDAQNQFYAVQGLIRDITEKKKQEINLENQRKRLVDIVKLNSQIIEASDQFYYVATVSGRQRVRLALKYLSPQVTNLIGCNELDLMRGENFWYNYVHPEDVMKITHAINKILDTKEPTLITYRLKKEGEKEYRWFDDYSRPMLNDRGEVFEIYGSVRDVTEREISYEAIKSEQQQAMAYQYQLLSSQLNPHFTYNTLNSFQYYILQGNVEESLNHIADFSKLMRKVLENSMHHFISLDEEIQFLEQYIRISKRRMQEQMTFTTQVEAGLDTADYMIPPMLLQPYIENAIIHAFPETGMNPRIILGIAVRKNRMEYTIQDNGIGRQASLEKKKSDSLQANRKSYAMSINTTRIDLLNRIMDKNFEVEVVDTFDPENEKQPGTMLRITHDIIGNSDEEE
ncbi:MAG: PAS domain S-box protein [Crocinitomicaceae bacterium]|nr:PAS domain S-box protein [Crocinitomicaceae bacterium]